LARPPHEKYEEEKMLKNILLLMLLVPLAAGCAVRRAAIISASAPGWGSSCGEDRRTEVCLPSGRYLPHDQARGNCLRCHLILEGE
jgi:hypothetical protein